MKIHEFFAFLFVLFIYFMDVEVNLCSRWFNLMLFIAMECCKYMYFWRKNCGIRFWREFFFMV